MTWTLEYEHDFDAAHWLPDHPGKCKALHGHRWVVTIELAAEGLDHQSMVTDFGEVKRTMGRLIDEQLDHRTLNEVVQPPTAEVLASTIFSWLDQLPIGEGVRLAAVTVQESPGCRVRYVPTRRTHP